jgi:hypothetical protein
VNAVQSRRSESLFTIPYSGKPADSSTEIESCRMNPRDRLSGIPIRAPAGRGGGLRQ